MRSHGVCENPWDFHSMGATILQGTFKQDFKIKGQNLKDEGQKIKMTTMQRPMLGWYALKYEAVAIFYFQAMAWTKLSSWRSYFKGWWSKGYNNLTVHRFYSKLICPENMKQLSVQFLSAGQDKIFRNRFQSKRT